MALLVSFAPSYFFSQTLTATSIYGFWTTHGATPVAVERAWHLSRAFVVIPFSLLAGAVYFGVRGRVGRWHSIWWVYIATLLLLYVLVAEAALTFLYS